MGSLRFPDTGTRMVVYRSGAPAANQTGKLFADQACTTAAEVYADNSGAKGALIADSSINLDQYGQQPDYWGPVAGTDTLWIRVNGVVSKVDADYNARLDAVAAKVALNVKDYGVLGDGTTDDTAAIQAIINSLPATGSTDVLFPAGRYRYSTLNLGERSITLIGVSPNMDTPSAFGSAANANSNTFRGTWLVSTATTGNALTVGSNGGNALDYRYALRNIGVVGPGSGTSNGILIEDSAGVRFDGVHIVNFATGLKADFVQDSRFTDTNAWGCGTGIYLDGNSNQNVFVNTNVQFNSAYGIRLEATDTNLFLAGATEVNSGTPIYLGSLCRKAVFDNWYFEDLQGSWPAPITWVVDSPGSENTFRDCRFKLHGQNCGDIRFGGNSNSLITPYNPPSVTLNGTANLLLGTFLNTAITETVPGTNAIITYQGASLPSDLQLPAANRLVIGPSSVTAATAARLASTTADALTAGEYVPSRERAFSTNGIAPTTGTIALTYWTADKTETITALTVWSGGVAAGATPTLCRMAIYSVAANGDLTLVAATPNDTSLFAATNTIYAKSLSGSFAKAQGTRYATAVLVVTGAAMPTFHGYQMTATNGTSAAVRIAPAIVGRVTGQTDLPSSISAGSVIGWQAQIGMQLT